MGLARKLALIAAFAVVALFGVIAVEYLYFQGLALSCPQTLGPDSCWAAYYLPRFPPHSAAVIIHSVGDIYAAYGIGQPALVRVFDYYKLMLTGNFGYNIGYGNGGTVWGSVSSRFSFEILLAGAASIAALAVGLAARVVKLGRVERTSRTYQGAGFLIAAGAAAAVSWNLGAGSFNSFILDIVPRWYVPLGEATLLKSGWAYDLGVIQALWPPLVTLAVLGVATILALRLVGGSPVDLPVAVAAVLATTLVWEYAVETFFGWPGLAQAIFIGSQYIDLPLQQAAVFIMALVAIVGTSAALFIHEMAGRSG